jgi:peptidoglycan/xylan/chitin deacetylase (PgdA/CDA1 family)
VFVQQFGEEAQPAADGKGSLLLRVCFIILLILAASHLNVPRVSAEGVPVLIYHEVLDSLGDPGETRISLDRFREQMKYLHDNGYTTMSIDELVAFMKGGAAPEKGVVLTFDDGWLSMRDAIPVLNHYRFKASFWIFPGAGIGYPYMEWPEIVEMAGNPNFEIGSHSLTHSCRNEDLVTWAEGKTAGRTKADTALEIEESRRILEKMLQRKVTYLAWPKGAFNERLVEMAREAGYEALLTTREGANLPGDDVFRIKRIFVDGACDMEVFARTLKDHKYYRCQAVRQHAGGTLLQANASSHPGPSSSVSPGQ